MRALLSSLPLLLKPADLCARIRQWWAALTPQERLREKVSWSGAGLGLWGSNLLANNDSTSGYGFLAFLASNACWLWFGVRTRTWAMVLMQLGFTWTSLKGIHNWLL